MTRKSVMRGVFAPVLTPFDQDLNPDPARFTAHCRRLLDEGCHGLVPFGTTGEANSLSSDERVALTEAAVEAGVPPDKLMVGVGLCAIPETVRLTRHAVASGCAGVLMLPPFYYKGMSDDGLFRAYAEVIERVGDARLRVYLYHFPKISNVPLSHALIERLLAAYPETVVGIKDSTGDWQSTSGLLSRFPGFGVYPGNEILMLAALRAGSPGCITATANVNARLIRRLYDARRSPEADALQARVTAIREAAQAQPMIPGLKRVLAQRLIDPLWATVRPPFTTLDAAPADALRAALADAGLDLAQALAPA